jgi:cyanate lyase
MRITRRLVSESDRLPIAKTSYNTTFLWTERGVIDTAAMELVRYILTEDPDIFELVSIPFKGSVSKVYHSEPATIYKFSKNMWRERTPTSDFVYTVSSHDDICLECSRSHGYCKCYT